jgi:hypothetical protein
MLHILIVRTLPSLIRIEVNVLQRYRVQNPIGSDLYSGTAFTNTKLRNGHQSCVFLSSLFSSSIYYYA